MHCRTGYTLEKIKHLERKRTKKRAIGLFFGSFNPIHLGHIQLAEYIYQQSDFDELWYVVSPRNPLKEQAGLIDEQHRKAMIELATTDKDYIKVSDIEFDMPKPSYTIHTLEKLAETYPDCKFTLIIGSDNVLVFDQWKDYQQILQNFSVLVYPRQGYDAAPYLSLYPQMQLLEEAPHFEISSTEIRESIQKNNPINDWLHPDVIQYIEDNDLYKVGK